MGTDVVFGGSWNGTGGTHPGIGSKLEEFDRRYGTVILSIRPALPRHKAKIEAGVKCAQNGAVKGFPE